MVFRWVINAGLLALPIGATVGVLMGLDMHRTAQGQAPLFTPGPGDSKVDGGGDGRPTDHRVTETRYCDLQVGVSPPSAGSKYTLNPNQWGYDPAVGGAMCMNITAFHNGSYATEYTAPEFTVTWQYPPGPITQPVHAYPNIQVAGKRLPIKLTTLRNININTEWTYGVGNEPAAVTDEAALAVALVNTNVAFDMFLDSTENDSTNSSKAAYEVMVWLAGFGASTQPIGFDDKIPGRGVVTTKVQNGTTFDLYTGKNNRLQNVLSWVAQTTTEKFTGDIAPLVTALTTIPGVTFPFADLYMGHLGLGSEAFSSAVNITLSMPKLEIDIETA